MEPPKFQNYDDIAKELELEYEAYLSETGDIQKMLNYIKVNARPATLYAYPVSDGQVEYGFTTYHYYDAITAGLRQLLRGKGCASWRIIFVDKVSSMS